MWSVWWHYPRKWRELHVFMRHVFCWSPTWADLFKPMSWAMTEPWHTSQISILQKYGKEKYKVGIQKILKGWEKRERRCLHPMKHEYHFLRCSDYFKEKKTQWRNCFKPSLNLVICTTWRPFCKQLLKEFWASLVCFLILWHKSQKTLITRNKYCLHAQGIIYSWQNKSQETKLVLSIIRWLQITDNIRSVNFFTVYFINFIFLIHKHHVFKQHVLYNIPATDIPKVQ